MHFTTTLLPLLLAAAGLTSAQYTIDPNSVPLGTREQWCEFQQTQCPLLCLQYPGNSAATTYNKCFPETLDYGCICAVNGLSPNASEYSQTLPYFICTEWGNQCVKNCGQNNACANDCRANHPCGAKNPTLYNTSTMTSTMSATATGSGGSAATDADSTAVYTGFGGAQASSTLGSSDSGSSGNGGTGAGAALNAGQSFGVVVLAAFLGGFALML